jgi:hypothetical protein
VSRLFLVPAMLLALGIAGVAFAVPLSAVTAPSDLGAGLGYTAPVGTSSYSGSALSDLDALSGTSGYGQALDSTGYSTLRSAPSRASSAAASDVEPLSTSSRAFLAATAPTYDITGPQRGPYYIPEPGSFALLGLGLAALLVYRKRRRA